MIFNFTYHFIFIFFETWKMCYDHVYLSYWQKKKNHKKTKLKWKNRWALNCWNVSTSPKTILVFFSSRKGCWLLFFLISWKKNEKSHELLFFSKPKAWDEIKYTEKMFPIFKFMNDHQISAKLVYKQKSVFKKGLIPLSQI